MEIQKPSGGSVKRSDAKKQRKIPLGEPPLELTRSCKRVRGYLVKVFAQDKPYHDWDKHAFHRRSQWIRNELGQRIPHKYPLSVRHIELVVAVYRKICTEFVWLPARKGRANILRIVRADPDGELLPIPEIWRRLVGYIQHTVANNGVAHVDQQFLKHFRQATGLPPELVHMVWDKMRRMKGFRVRWRGVNAGRKMVVTRNQSHTHHASRPISTHYVSEGINPKTTGLTPRSTGGSSAPLRVARTDQPHAGGVPTSGEHASRAPPTHDAGFPNRSSSTEPPDPKRTNWSAPPASSHDPPQWPVLIVCGRPVDGRKLARLANLLAVTSMRGPHDEFYRVRWIFVYPRNFAYRALRDGFGVPEILDAWRSGVWRSHEDSLDADRALEGADGFRREPVRVPSAAVTYATVALHAGDLRTREDRWSEIFARGPRVGPPVAKTDVAKMLAARPRMPDPTAEDSALPGPVVKPARGAVARRPLQDIAQVRAWLEQKQAEAAAAKSEQPVSPAHEFGALKAGELIAWLRDRQDMTAAQFAALPWTARQTLIGACRKFYAKPGSG